MGLPLGRQRGSSCARRRRVLFALVVSILLFSFGGAGALAKISRVFIVPISHLDIGFTATPREVSVHYRVTWTLRYDW